MYYKRIMFEQIIIDKQKEHNIYTETIQYGNNKFIRCNIFVSKYFISNIINNNEDRACFLNFTRNIRVHPHLSI
jgi:hypothetical protein